MNKTLRIVLISVGATVAAGYIIFALAFMPDMKKEQVCHDLNIDIQDSTRRQFITDSDLRVLLRQNGVMPENKPYSEIQTQDVENAAKKAEVLAEAECYKTNEGVVSLCVRQREPRLRVISSENYYVDSNRGIMRASYKTACHVPVVTGNVNREMAQNELFNFVEWLDDHSFWFAQIEQINVLPNKEIELVPRVGGHTILLGRLEDYDSKLEKLQVFYDEGLSMIGWVPYREIDLRFKGQIVCR